MLPAANTINQSLSTDPRSLDRLRASALTDKSGATKGAAQQFEALLLQQMLSAMRKSVPKEGFDQSAASEVFQGMRDEQWAQNWAGSGGIGFAKLIERQLNIQQNPALLQQVQSKMPNVDLRSLPSKSLSTFAAAMAAKPAADTGRVAAATGTTSKTETSGAIPDFINKLGQAAKATADSLGVAPHVLLAHAALETGWGKKAIKDSNGSDSHNLFGIKAGSSWQGKTVDVLTTEYVDGVAQKRVEKFRAYDSYADSFADYASLIKRRFGDAVAQGSDVAGFAKALVAGGYATDPQYAQKLTQVAGRVADQLGASNSRIGA